MPDRILGERCVLAGWYALLGAVFGAALIVALAILADALGRMLESWTVEV